MNTKQLRSLTGIRPSGDLHLGNYLGAIAPGLTLQEQHECLYFIADMHSLTTTKDPQALRSHTYDIVAAWIALGLDTQKHLIYRQSDLPQVAEFAWYLSCVTGFGLLSKAHSYKDASAHGKEVNHGVFAYPVLMAADIILYDADVVPVGKDQKQHVEMARDMAGSFNALYGAEILKLPTPLIREEVMVIPGLDGRKMSKSYNNTIPLFSSEKELRKKIMSLKTDSTSVEDPKELKNTLLGDLFKLFASTDQFTDLESRLGAGGLGWGHAKQELFELINASISEARLEYQKLRTNEQKLDAILRDGAKRAFDIAQPILQKVRIAQGFQPTAFQRV